MKRADIREGSTYRLDSGRLWVVLRLEKVGRGHSVGAQVMGEDPTRAIRISLTSFAKWAVEEVSA
jgi:hypothetical protein